jgi:hypothetical protein
MTHVNLGDLKQELEKEAKVLGLSLNAYIRMLLKVSKDRVKI